MGGPLDLGLWAGEAGCREDTPPSCTQPQQVDFPAAVSTLSTPSCGSSVTSLTPVSKKSRPGLVFGLVPSLASLAIASTPLAAISNGYCCAVAPMMPSLT